MSAIWQWHQVEVYKYCKKSNIPYIVTPHGSFGTWAWNQSRIKKKTYWHLFGKKTITNASAIHFTAEAERKDSMYSLPIIQNIPNFIVPNGIKLNKKNNKQDIRQLLNIPRNEFIILFLGRIHRKKGIDLFLKALRFFKNHNVHFVIVGPKNDQTYCSYLRLLLKKFDIERNVIWYGPVTKDKIWDFYYASDIMVLTSHSENFGMTVVEAMHCGLPVLISKNVGIWKEVVDNGAGIAVDLKVNTIVNGLKKLLTNPPLLKKMSENARRVVENRYNIDKIASLMIKAYEDVLTGRRSPELRWKE